MAVALCKKCKVPMQPGKAFINPMVTSPDFIGQKPGDGCTISPDPTRAVLIDCLKCPQCGWSVTHKEDSP